MLDILMLGCILASICIILTGGGADKVGLTRPDGIAVVLLLLGLLRWKLRGDFMPEKLRTVSKRWETEITSPVANKVLSIALTIYVFVYSILQSRRYLSLRANAFDLGFVDQSLWTTAHGFGFLHSDLSRGGTYLGEHFAPILALLSPFYLLFDSPYWLFVCQSLLIAAGGVILCRIALKMKLSPFHSLLIVLLYLLYLPLRAANQFDFREDLFFLPIFFSMIFAMLSEQMFLFWMLGLLSLVVKEDAPIVIFLLSCWLIVKNKKLHGLGGIVLSGCSFIVLNRLVIPHFSGGLSTTLVDRLGFLGHSNQEIISTIYHKPWLLLKVLALRVLDKRGLIYLMRVWLPALPFLFLLPWVASMPWFIALALTSMNLVGVNSVRAVGSHYELILVPFLFSGMILRSTQKTKEGRTSTLSIGLVLALIVFGQSPIYLIRKFNPTHQELCIHKILARINPDVSVSTQYALFPHLSRRPHVDHFKEAASVKDDVIALSLMDGIDLWAEETLPAEFAKVPSDRYQPVFTQKNLSIWCENSKCTHVKNMFTGPDVDSCLKNLESSG